MKNQTIREISSLSDIEACVNLYAKIASDHFIPFDISKSKRSLRNLAYRKKFIRVMEIDGIIRGWIFAEPVMYLHVNEPIMQQIYYASDLSGISSARCVKSLHNAMADEAYDLGIRLVMSQGSCFDEENIMAKILEKAGWTRRGHTVAKILWGETFDVVPGATIGVDLMHRP